MKRIKNRQKVGPVPTEDMKTIGTLTEDEFYDFDLDRNYEYSNIKLIHNFDTVG